MVERENQAMRMLHENMLDVFRWRSILSTSLLLLGAIAYQVCAYIWSWPLWPAIAACIGAIVLFVLFVFIWPRLEYQYFAFAVHEEEMEIKQGVWFRSHVLIPMSKVQHVETETGPLLRTYGLASTMIVTAAGTHKISGLLQKEADELKSYIGKLARVVDTDE
ncbi:PH domain-containing protein [Paenibacillus sp. SC116]|uniref:PH domain-containing protein n=1 Tax=Paenibacillus sp. SC116 TaxID=2968986 RepID=UPI00215AD8DF|nr:PH domain-containing protein [Paenibacillus sp. SC116]MCR8843270.1 PH domain-containing protein [Paenibacillus sp. SC116]